MSLCVQSCRVYHYRKRELSFSHYMGECAIVTTLLPSTLTLLLPLILLPCKTLKGAPQHRERVLYLITTTYRKDTQKADLVSLCHTLKHVPSLVWIVVENSASQSPVIQAVLGRCNISAIHLTVQTPETVKSTWKYSPKVTGVAHRNAGLTWVREHCLRNKCEGVVYFGDDDDKYDLRFFEEVSFN